VVWNPNTMLNQDFDDTSAVKSPANKRSFEWAWRGDPALDEDFTRREKENRQARADDAMVVCLAQTR